jgi:hypothetical protein
LNVAFRTHPFHTVRAAELQRWVQSGGYSKILSGDYVRRGDAGDRPLGDDYADAAGYYGTRARSMVEEVGGVLKNARDAFSDKFRGSQKG